MTINFVYLHLFTSTKYFFSSMTSIIFKKNEHFKKSLWRETENQYFDTFIKIGKKTGKHRKTFVPNSSRCFSAKGTLLKKQNCTINIKIWNKTSKLGSKLLKFWVLHIFSWSLFLFSEVLFLKKTCPPPGRNPVSAPDTRYCV